LTRKGFSIREVADEIEWVINEHYQRTPDQPTGYEDMLHREVIRDWYRDGERVTEIIASVADIENSVAEDIREFLP
jgi:hypothetical protein